MQIGFIGIGVMVLAVEVEEVRSQIDGSKHLCGSSLAAKVQPGQSRQVRKIEAGIDGRPTWICQGRGIVITVHVAIDSEPISQTRHTVGEIESRLAIAGIVSIAKGGGFAE